MKQYKTTREAESFNLSRINVSNLDYPVSQDIARSNSTLIREVGSSSVATTVTRDTCLDYKVQGDGNNRTKVHLCTEHLLTAPQEGVIALAFTSVRGNIVTIPQGRPTKYSHQAGAKHTVIKCWYESEHGEMLSRCSDQGCKTFLPLGLDSGPNEVEGDSRSEWLGIHSQCETHSKTRLRLDWHLKSSIDAQHKMGKRTKKALSAVRAEAKTSEALAGWSFRKVKTSTYTVHGKTGAMRHYSESVYTYPPKSLSFATPELYKFIIKTNDMMQARYPKDDLPEGKQHHRSYSVNRCMSNLKRAIRECEYYKENGVHSRQYEDNPFEHLRLTLDALDWAMSHFKDSEPGNAKMVKELSRIERGYHDVVTSAIAKISEVLLRSNLTVESSTVSHTFQNMLRVFAMEQGVNFKTASIEIKIENHDPIWESVFDA